MTPSCYDHSINDACFNAQAFCDAYPSLRRNLTSGPLKTSTLKEGWRAINSEYRGIAGDSGFVRVDSYAETETRAQVTAMWLLCHPEHNARDPLPSNAEIDYYDFLWIGAVHSDHLCWKPIV